jgi:hypothetical protein
MPDLREYAVACPRCCEWPHAARIDRQSLPLGGTDGLYQQNEADGSRLSSGCLPIPHAVRIERTTTRHRLHQFSVWPSRCFARWARSS